MMLKVNMLMVQCLTYPIYIKWVSAIPTVMERFGH